MTRILASIGCYLPGVRAGGPIRSLSNTVVWLGHEYEFLIITPDHDLNDVLPYPNVRYDEWCQIGQARVRYLSHQEERFFKLRQIVSETPHDTIYLHSFFSPFTRRLLVARKLGMIPNRPTIIAPRGEFSSGALGLKATKKRAYLAWSRWIGLCNGVIWQATSSLEREDIHRWWPSATEDSGTVVLAPNLPAMVETDRESAPTRDPKIPGRARVAFLGRISPIKNLHLGLEALLGVRGNVTFDIYGPIEDTTYWRTCQKAISALPNWVRVEYRGTIQPDRVGEVLSSYHLFLMLSESENFGHAILEALSAGCVVLIGDRTPWQGLVAKGVGWDVPLGDTSRVVSALQQFLALDQVGFSRMSAASRRIAQEFQNAEENMNAYRRLFAIGGPAQDPGPRREGRLSPKDG